MALGLRSSQKETTAMAITSLKELQESLWAMKMEETLVFYVEDLDLTLTLESIGHSTKEQRVYFILKGVNYDSR